MITPPSDREICLMGFLSEEKVFIEVEFPQMQENEEIKMIKRKATF